MYSSERDSIKPIITALGGPGVPQTKINEGAGVVTLNVIKRNTEPGTIPENLRIYGRRFGSRFGHAVQFIDLNGDG